MAPAGPFERKSVLMKEFSHNPVVAAVPATDTSNSSYAVFHIGKPIAILF
jgi:hypothetical protein